MSSGVMFKKTKKFTKMCAKKNEIKRNQVIIFSIVLFIKFSVENVITSNFKRMRVKMPLILYSPQQKSCAFSFFNFFPYVFSSVCFLLIMTS